MAVDKNLFLYDVAVGAIMKNEGHYIKEWIDYHLLAGVDHFFIYDNESPDNQKEILQPYIDAGIVTYKFFPNKNTQNLAYNDATRRFKFFCRYLTFIDGDEFILPKKCDTISEIANTIFNDKSNVGGFTIHWRTFGSNGHEKADYSKGVLDRFTRRAFDNHSLGKSGKYLTNPRKISYWDNPHFTKYFENFYLVDTNVAEEIILNHYVVKSKEEFVERKVRNGRVDVLGAPRDMKYFENHDLNDVFDDEILRYRAARLDAFTKKWGGSTPSYSKRKLITRAF